MKEIVVVSFGGCGKVSSLSSEIQHTFETKKDETTFNNLANNLMTLFCLY